MAKLTELTVSTRAKAGKGAARATRRNGMVPGVVYGGKKEPTLIEIDPRLIMKELQRGGWGSRLYQLNVGSDKVRTLLRDIQFHPVSDAPLHVDFQRMTAGQKVHVSVPVIFENEETCPGIKLGGVMNVVRHTVDVECDVDHLPEHFVGDLAALEIGDSLHWKDLKGTDGVVAHGDIQEAVIVTIAAPMKEEPEEPAEGEEAAEAAEGEAAPAAEAKEAPAE